MDLEFQNKDQLWNSRIDVSLIGDLIGERLLLFVPYCPLRFLRIDCKTFEMSGKKGSNWQEVLKSQNDDLRRLEAMDAELNEDVLGLDADISSVMRKTTISNLSRGTGGGASSSASASANAASSRTSSAPFGSVFHQRDNTAQMRDMYNEDDIGEEEIGFPAGDDNRNSLAQGSAADDIQEIEMYLDGIEQRPKSSPTQSKSPAGSLTGTTPKAPASNLRFQNAKLKVLTKQLEDEKQLRQKMNEQINDLQRQLKTERDDSKSYKKRIQVLELEQRKGTTTSRRPTSGSTTARSNDDLAATIDNLNQEIAVYKKDAATAERLAKQAASDAKAKDTQLKRSSEAIARLKEQVADLQTQMKSNVRGDASKVSELEARIRDLEKQRTDILGAFRKQIKLIDILKRQKIHLEAARLLTFTEEEFMKTLEWGV